MDKTNVMRLLDQGKIAYAAHFYDPEAADGMAVAQAVGIAPEQVFKTLAARGASRQVLIFVIPVNGELDLKKAAKAAGEKSIAMLPQKELLPLTGYMHGGCSPIGMKKKYPTWLDETAKNYDTICVSAGKRGAQVELAPDDLKAKYGELKQG